MNEAIEKLGSKIKMLFDRKRIEDNEASEKVSSEMMGIKDAIINTKQAIEEAKEKVNAMTLKEIKTLQEIIQKKDLSVKVEPPIVNIPEPKIKLLRENKEAVKSNELLEKLIYAVLKQGESSDVRISNHLPQDAIPVKLTDRSGKKFYDAMFQALSSGAGYPFRLPNGESARANLDADGNIMVQLDMSDVAINNFPADYPLPLDQLSTLTPPPAITGFSLEETQQDVLTQLVSLNGIDFATEAKQDAIIAILNTLATEATLDNVVAVLGGIENLLGDIRDTDIDILAESVLIFNKLVDIYNRQNDIITAINSDPALSASSPTTATIGIASVQILPANASRKGLTITNLSTKDIFLGFNGWAAVVNSGVVITASGGTYNMDRFDKTTGVVKAIAQQAGSVLSIQEYT